MEKKSVHLEHGGLVGSISLVTTNCEKLAESIIVRKFL